MTENKRLIVRVLTASVLTFILTIPVFGLILSGPASAAAAISVFIFWKRLIKKGETRSKGALYGALAGILTAILTGMLAGLIAGITSFLSSEMTGKDLLAIPFMMFGSAAFFGGIVGLLFGAPIGALAGFVMSRDQPQAT